LYFNGHDFALLGIRDISQVRLESQCGMYQEVGVSSDTTVNSNQLDP
jgi:hypothetical protein